LCSKDDDEVLVGRDGMSKTRMWKKYAPLELRICENVPSMRQPDAKAKRGNYSSMHQNRRP
jgi:hypothetical protein